MGDGLPWRRVARATNAVQVVIMSIIKISILLNYDNTDNLHCLNGHYRISVGKKCVRSMHVQKVLCVCVSRVHWPARRDRGSHHRLGGDDYDWTTAFG
jgi:hypothetical protein